MDGVTCWHCGAQGATHVEATMEGLDALSADLCPPCLAAATGRLEAAQDDFYALVDRGVHRKMAARITLVRLHEARLDTPPPRA